MKILVQEPQIQRIGKILEGTDSGRQAKCLHIISTRILEERIIVDEVDARRRLLDLILLVVHGSNQPVIRKVEGNEELVLRPEKLDGEPEIKIAAHPEDQKLLLEERKLLHEKWDWGLQETIEMIVRPVDLKWLLEVSLFCFFGRTPEQNEENVDNLLRAYADPRMGQDEKIKIIYALNKIGGERAEEAISEIIAREGGNFALLAAQARAIDDIIPDRGEGETTLHYLRAYLKSARKEGLA